MRIPIPVLRSLAALVLVFLGTAASLAAPVDLYTSTLKPLLRDRCFSCHGALQQKAGLRLDTVAFMQQGGKSGTALVPGQPEKSPLLLRTAAADLAERMPPEHEAQPLSPPQIDSLRAWITSGAPAPRDETPEADPASHWSFRPPIRPSVPPLPPSATVHPTGHPIDAFLEQGRQSHGITPNPEAARPILLRRLFLDLIGVPPTAADLESVEQDTSPDWYERRVDRLLADPRHGERWARHWMDVWRYSDAWGLGDQLRNSQHHIWHWRDWIVESINADTPYDEMIRLMLAADESHPEDLSRLRATGFLARNFFLFNRNQWMDETVEHVAKGFLGLTLNCAKCHDHKYDPFSQADYYRFRAFFEPYHVRIDTVPGEPDMTRDGIPRAFDRHLEQPTYRFVRGQENAPDTSKVMSPAVPALLAKNPPLIQPIALPPTAWQPERRPWSLSDAIAAARSRRDRLHSQSDATAAARTVADVELESVERRASAAQAEWISATDADSLRVSAIRAERRLAVARAQLTLAEAETAWTNAAPDKKEATQKQRDTARQKLAEAQQAASKTPTASDRFTPFRAAAWTPTRFLDSTKDDPDTGFPRTSTGRRTALAKWITQRSNPLTARVAVNHVWNRHFGVPLVPTVFDLGRKGSPPAQPELLDWLAVEFMDSHWSLRHLHRLIVTSAAYRMSSSLAGADRALAADPDNLWWWRRDPIRLEAQVVRDSLLFHSGQLAAQMGGPSVPASAQDASPRRSLYFFHSNNDRNLFLSTFDDALVKECYRREQSIVPQQALALLNSRLVDDASPDIARRIQARSPDEAAFVRESFRTLLGFEPSPQESSHALDALQHWIQAAPPGSTPSAARERARTHLAWTLLNHGDFVTLR